jgi:hypothetical protein
MPRYFFHRADGSMDRDTEGTELAGVSDARKLAIVFAGETLRDCPELAWSGKEFRVEIEDEAGHVLFVLRVSAEDRLHKEA